MANPPNVDIRRYSASMDTTEFSFFKLYLHHIYSGPTPNQLQIVLPSGEPGANAFGTTVVNSWEIYDGIGKGAQLVAHAQGMHIFAKSWHNSFTIVFDMERFKESTLQVMGASTEKEGEWSVIGGTGEFTMAHGVIRRTVHEKLADGEILELTIRGFCITPTHPTITKITSGFGDVLSSRFDIKGKPRYLESVTVRFTSEYIVAFSFTYTNQNWQKQTMGPYGGSSGGKEIVIRLEPSESLTQVVRAFSLPRLDNRNKITSLEFVTSIRRYGPYGKPNPGEALTLDVPKGNVIVGFHGSYAADYLSKLEVYTYLPRSST